MKKFLILLLILPLFAIGARGIERSDASELYSRAERRLESSDYSLALELYNRLCREYPLSAFVSDSQFRIGQCYFHLGDNRRALEQLKRVSRRYSSTSYAGYLPFWRGILSYKLGNPDEAEKELGEYISRGTSSRDADGNFSDVYRKEAYLYRALSLKNLGRKDEAVGLLEELNRLFSGPAADPYILTLLGNYYLEDRRMTDLEKLLSPVDISLVPPPWFEYLSFLKAEVLFHKGEEEEALSLYLRLTGSGSSAAGPAYERSFSIYLDRGEFDLLQGLISRGEIDLKENPGLLEDFYLRAGIEFYRSGITERGAFYLEKVWKGQAESIPHLVPLYLSRIAADDGLYAQGLEYLDYYLKISSDGRERIYYTRGEILTRLDSWEEASGLWETFFEEYPDSEFTSPASYQAGYAAYQLGNYEQALEYFSGVNIGGLDGEQRKGLLRMEARLLGWTGDYKGANRAWEDYLAIYPDDWSSRGEALKAKFLSGDYEGTIGDSLILKRRGESMDDKALSALAYYLSGLSFLAQDRYHGALDDFLLLTEKQLKQAGIGEVYPFVLYYRGWAHYQSADYVMALRDFSDLSELLAKDQSGLIPSAALMTRAAYLAGWCAYQQGEYDLAADFFEKYSRMDDESGQGMLMYARSLAESGRNRAAAGILEEAFRKSRMTDAGDDMLFELASQLFLAGDTEQSMRKYLELYETYPRSVLAEESLYQRGEKYLSLGEWIKAQEAFYLCRRSFPDGKLAPAAHFWGGEAARLGGEDFGAVLLWDRLIDEYPDSPFRSSAIRKIGEIYMERGDYKKSLEYYGLLNDEYPREAGTLEAVTARETLRYLSLGESEEIAGLKAEISTYGGLEAPESRESMLELARILLYRGGEEMDDARLLLEDLVFYKEEDLDRAARAQYYLGEYYFRLSEFQKSIDAFLSAAVMNPDDRDLMAMSIYRGAETAVEMGRSATVSELVRRLEENFPDSEWYAEGLRLLEAVR